MLPPPAEPSRDVDWTPVSHQHPCAICGSHDRCRRGFADEFACCVRMVSDWPLTTGGWVHRVDSPRSDARAGAVGFDLENHAATGVSLDDPSADTLRADP